MVSEISWNLCLVIWRWICRGTYYIRSIFSSHLKTFLFLNWKCNALSKWLSSRVPTWTALLFWHVSYIMLYLISRSGIYKLILLRYLRMILWLKWTTKTNWKAVWCSNWRSASRWTNQISGISSPDNITRTSRICSTPCRYSWESKFLWRINCRSFCKLHSGQTLSNGEQ